MEKIAEQAHQAEDAGFDGMFVINSQNLWMECGVADGTTEEEQADVTHLMLNEVLPDVAGRARFRTPG